MGLSDYAKNTMVSLESSRMELERLLRRAGASKAMIGWDSKQAYVAFVLNDIPIKQKVTMPPVEEFGKTDQNRDRKKDAQFKAWDQACRQRMREFVQLIKAKLIAIHIGVRSIEQEFFADICLPSGQTIYEVQGLSLEEALAGKKLPALLPGL